MTGRKTDFFSCLEVIAVNHESFLARRSDVVRISWQKVWTRTGEENMSRLGGKVLFLDRSDINTDEIIPARYLTEIDKESLKPYLLEDLKLEGFNPQQDIQGKGAILTRANFGCGSSREHAPWALEVNGIRLVVAESFARIFRQNMFNCGMAAVSLPSETIDRLFTEYSGQPAEMYADIEAMVIEISSGDRSEQIPFVLSDFDRDLVRAGGWVEYADLRY